MASSNQNKYFLGYRLNNSDGWQIINRSFCHDNFNNNIKGQFLQTTWFSCLINDCKLIEFIIIEKTLNSKRKFVINKINQVKNINEFNDLPEIHLYCNVNLKELNELKNHLKYNINQKKENLSSIQCMPQVLNLVKERHFNKKTFEVKVCAQRNNDNMDKLDYVVTLPSFVI